MIEALRLVAGDDGLAPAYAFRDIVLDPETPPACRPVSEVLDALATVNPGRRCRNAGLRAALGCPLVRMDAEHE